MHVLPLWVQVCSHRPPCAQSWLPESPQWLLLSAIRPRLARQQQPTLLPLTAAAAACAGGAQSWLPDSPRWLLLSGAGSSAAAEALARARGKYGADSAAVDAEVAAMERSIAETGASGTPDTGAPFIV